MAYMRGDYCLWDDESGLHIWAADGYDGWDESGWHRDAEGNIHSRHLRDGDNVASGVSIPQEIMDEYVMMRLAELLEAGHLEETLDRTLRRWERPSLRGNVARLRAGFQRAVSEPPAV